MALGICVGGKGSKMLQNSLRYSPEYMLNSLKHLIPDFSHWNSNISLFVFCKLLLWAEILMWRPLCNCSQTWQNSPIRHYRQYSCFQRLHGLLMVHNTLSSSFGSNKGNKDENTAPDKHTVLYTSVSWKCNVADEPVYKTLTSLCCLVPVSCGRAAPTWNTLENSLFVDAFKCLRGNSNLPTSDISTTTFLSNYILPFAFVFIYI